MTKRRKVGVRRKNCVKNKSVYQVSEVAAVFKILVNSMSSSGNIDARLSLLAANACLLFDPTLFKQFSLDTLVKYYKNMGNNEAALRTLALILPYVEDTEELKNISAMSKVIEFFW